MNVTYSDTAYLKNCTISERIYWFEITVSELLLQGYCVGKIKQAMHDFEYNEMYEASQGIKNALNHHNSTYQVDKH